MAQRRMISKAIHQDGRFLSLSPVSKILYDDLVLYADDDGFCPDTSLINLMDKAKDSNYKELEKAGLIVCVDGVYLIVDWLNTQLLNHYSRTSFLASASKVFIKIDFKYTVNEKDENIALSLDDWVERKNRSRKISLKSLQQQRLKDMVNKRITSGKPTVNKKFTKGSPSIDKYSIDKTSTDQNSLDQQRAEKATSASTTTTSSNGGMGENSSSSFVSTSSIDNNATRENGVITGEDSGVTTSSNETEINYLFDYLNGLFDGDNIPSDNERLNKLFDTLLDKYRPEFIQQALEQLANTIGTKYPIANVQQALIDHLDDTIKQVMAAQDEE